MKEYEANKDNLSRQTKEALLYIKKKVDAAQGFIEAIKVRRHTLSVTMRAIIQLQHQFFVDGDEASLRPMILKDVPSHITWHRSIRSSTLSFRRNIVI